MMKVCQERVVTPEQRQRHQELSAELAKLQTEEMQGWQPVLGDRGPPRAYRVRQRRIAELEARLADLAKQIRQQIPARLQELAATLDPNWLAVVSDPEIEGCGRSAGSWRLRFDFVCDKTWADLKPTREKHVRHCETCSQNVHFCDNLADAREHSQVGRCIAVDLGIIRRDGDLRPQEVVMGDVSIEDLRQSYEEEMDPVSQARLDARKQARKKRTERR
jgi:hypothetical protein